MGGAHAVAIPHIAAVKNEGMSSGLDNNPMGRGWVVAAPVTQVELGVFPDDGSAGSQAKARRSVRHVGEPAIALAACLLYFRRNFFVQKEIRYSGTTRQSER